jgi:hypothetical protein
MAGGGDPVKSHAKLMFVCGIYSASSDWRSAQTLPTLYQASELT